MSEVELVESYLLEYNKIREHAKSLKYTVEQIDECFNESLKILNNHKQNMKPKLGLISKALIGFVLILFIIYIMLYVHQPTSSLVLRNVQSFIYPGFKVVRKLGMPIISLFPSLTALYDETCLIENPYFQVSNLDCYPCENVHAVLNLTGLSLTNYSHYETGAPFIITDQRKQVFYDDIIHIYKQHQEVFNENAPGIKSNNASLLKIRDLLRLNHGTNGKIAKGIYIHWRINRMVPARILRKYFPRPGFISEWSGQSIERYVLIDGAESPGYVLPSFECSYVFLIQASGERDIILEPTTECRQNCRKISVRLKSSYILWYNWWYWKPLSLPAENSTNVSISYISSYC